MPEKTQTELLNIHGRELKLHCRSPRFGEWLAWCYVPGASMLHQDGVGFEARAATPEAAREAVVLQVTDHLAKNVAV